MSGNKKSKKKHLKELKRKKKMKDLKAKEEAQFLLDDILTGPSGYTFSLSHEWNICHPLGTFKDIPDELLQAWSVEIGDVFFEEGQFEEDAAGFYVAIMGSLNHTYKQQVGIPPEKSEEYFINLMTKWFMAMSWYIALRQKCEQTKLDDVIVFDHKFLEKLDPNKVEDEMEEIYLNLDNEEDTLILT